MSNSPSNETVAGGCAHGVRRRTSRWWGLAAFATMVPLGVANSATSAATILQTETYSGHTYHLIRGNGEGVAGINWTQAEDFAQSLGGHLVTVDDEDEQEWIAETFGAIDRRLWIGLSDAETEGVFKWANGTPFTSDSFQNWADGEPNNTTGAGFADANAEDYVYLSPANDEEAFHWNDLPNMPVFTGDGRPKPLFAVVEVIPEPATLSLVTLGAGLLLCRRR